MNHFIINSRMFNAYKQHSNLLLSHMQRVSFHTSHIQFREASGVHDYIKERTIKIGKYIVETRKTVRVIAKEFGVSKSTVHKDLTERLPEINPELANEVKEILDYHKSIRHLRGGEATKQKYRKEDTEKIVRQ
ncbi:sporulation transcriptional regulator SpoIIID [Bacillus pseudomycoides]|uniref:Sporulation transcriptional regulator SpoIIID n=1 Tax=Bacillus pseudomycoides TaxID=64104 RepID=A0A1Y3MHM4_9BACI|nr:sporulation transcriptional regulator SpoIIID [Bacillus pseudomycoides]PDY48158.1 sporulation transcriptional regulator SpoIIID [Bacillus pseudomycoides]PEA84092.1 sporulation transcriptional regulator SpoIIID [Bacillus pseudomycoides]PED07792.1 sporulation transcriptional regulator SpoIIID [Bacillus pseudomycoides]PED70980.1 sporulation transcriptional regulator SpoIIID [Bacillus pseudomycoides]